MDRMKKIIGSVTTGILLFGSLASPVGAIVQPQPWDVTGIYDIAFHLDGDPPATTYTHKVTLAQSGATVTGSGQYPAVGAPTYHWNITSGSVSNTTLALTDLYDLGTPGTVMHMTGTIAPDGSMSGIWDDNFGGPRTGTWATTSGNAKRYIPIECDGMLFDNVITGTNSSQVINGTSGSDLIFGKGGSDVIDGKAGNDCIVGGNGKDVISGGSGGDVILGGDNADVLTGGSGDDKLYGGADNDVVSGSSGTDTCVGEVKSSCEL